MTRVFANEDGNLDVKPIVTSRTKTHKDLDLTFTAKVGKDVYKKTESSSIKQGVKNLLMTNLGEKPFNYTFGGNLNNFLFENLDDLDEDELTDIISAAISNHEPRAQFISVKANIISDSNTLGLTVKFQILNTLEYDEINLQLTRLR